MIQPELNVFEFFLKTSTLEQMKEFSERLKSTGPKPSLQKFSEKIEELIKVWEGM